MRHAKTTNHATRPIWRTIWLLTCLLLCGGAHADKVTYILTDPNGTVLAEADAQGNITKTFDYRPYGQQALGQPPNGPGYTGHVNDPDTGLVYMQGRYYDPEEGRFVSVDPAGVQPDDVYGFNRYAYANNNPIVNIDPNGREAACVSMAGHCGGVANNLPVKDLTDLAGKLIEPLGAEQPGIGLAEEEIVIAEEAVSAVRTEQEVARAAAPNMTDVNPAVIAADQDVPLFSNKAPNDLIGDPKIVPNDRLSGISGNYNYVVTEDGSLIVGRSGHTSLTGGADVQAAGEIQLYNGNIKWIDNSSGHYQPFGPTIQPVTENAFNNIGLNATDKFQYRTW